MASLSVLVGHGPPQGDSSPHGLLKHFSGLSLLSDTQCLRGVQDLPQVFHGAQSLSQALCGTPIHPQSLRVS